jgi:Gpi18-like mannosyltransferase
MRVITVQLTIMKLMVLLVVAAAITAAVMWFSSFTPATAQNEEGPWCQHDWCAWYEVCRWEYWAWDAGEGWTHLHTDGYC